MAGFSPSARAGTHPVIAALALAALLSACTAKSGKSDESWRLGSVDRGRVVRAVSATGGLEPVITVDVGASVSGPIESVAVDYNAQVRVNQELARIDPQSFSTRVTQLRADVESQRAALSVQEAQLLQAQADLNSAKLELDRVEKLAPSGFASDQAVLVRATAHERAIAAVKLAEANIKAQRARVRQSEAQLGTAEVDLSRTVIRSPVNGVVVDRRVDPGQSVAASLQAPVLFQIAEDLSRLQANISVDEADIGDVREGQAVRFTVDAFPGEDFEGKVAQVRLLGVQNQGVVSYVVVVEANNPQNKLLPGMTANAEIRIEEKADVLRLPVAAIRFRPADPKIAALAESLAEAPGGAAVRNNARPAQNQGQNGGQNGGQNQGQNPNRGQNGAPGGGQGRGPGGGLQAFASSLDLTPEQTTKLQAAFQSAFASTAGRPGPESAPAERQAFFRRVRDAAFRTLEPDLNPAQLAKLKELRSAREGQSARDAVVWVLRNDAPAPIRVRLGLTDDSFAEILGGELKEKDEVIIGGGPRPKAQGATSVTPGGAQVRIRGG